MKHYKVIFAAVLTLLFTASGLRADSVKDAFSTLMDWLLRMPGCNCLTATAENADERLAMQKAFTPSSICPRAPICWMAKRRTRR